MFAEAIRGAAEFTRAVLISTRAMSGDVQTGLGTFIILNSEGWILTAAHIAEPFLKIQEDKRKLAELNAAKEAVLAQEGLSATKRERKLRALSVDSGWLTHVSCFWGADDIKAGVWHLDGAADLAAVRLVNFKLPEEQRFPKFGDPKIELPQGRSLCKLGYPFHNFKTEFDGASGRFKINEEVTLVRYPLDGILTRYNQVKHGDQRVVKFVEMSTPGLRGQSGGPVFDISGIVWGVQSRTHHLPLGFSPGVNVDGLNVTEHQFLNAGAATYVSEIVPFLEKHGISFESGS